MNMYLVQRHKYHPTNDEYEDHLHLTELYRLDYMGAAEFEWGAYSDIVRKIHANLSDLEQRVIVMDNYGTPIEVNFFFSRTLIESLRSDVEELLNTMVRYNGGEHISFKESTSFYERRFPRDNHSNKIVAWTDIRHGIFFTADHLSKEQYINLINNSVAYYDKQEAEYRAKHNKSFVVYWLNGTTSTVQGETIGKALTAAGFSNGAISAIDFYSEGDTPCSDYEFINNKWTKNGVER